MNRLSIPLAIVAVMAISSCGQSENRKENSGINRQAEALFHKGEIIASDNFTGTAWLNNLVQADSINQNAVGSVTFEPGARTKWHIHPAGQIILVLGGKGYYQEKGQQKRILHKGDVIKCPPNVPHWHGASTDTGFVQVAITGRQNGPTVWLEAVTEREYKGNSNE